MRYLRVDNDDEDTAIETMIAAAIAATADYLNTDVEDIDADAPAPVKSATLLMVCDLFESRGRQSTEPLYAAWLLRE